MIFASRDFNHDGKLTWEEWNVPGSGRTKKQFDAADTDKDGTVSFDEAISYAAKWVFTGRNFVKPTRITTVPWEEAQA